MALAKKKYNNETYNSYNKFKIKMFMKKIV